MNRQEALDNLTDLDNWPNRKCDTLDPPGWEWVETKSGIVMLPSDIELSSYAITKQDWLDAKEKTMSEWNGEGLPLEGSVCEADWNGNDKGWTTVKFHHFNGSLCWFSDGGKSITIGHADCQFRPIQSAADRERDEAIEILADWFDCHPVKVCKETGQVIEGRNYVSEFYDSEIAPLLAKIEQLKGRIESLRDGLNWCASGSGPECAKQCIAKDNEAAVLDSSDALQPLTGE